MVLTKISAILRPPPFYQRFAGLKGLLERVGMVSDIPFVFDALEEQLACEIRAYGVKEIFYGEGGTVKEPSSLGCSH